MMPPSLILFCRHTPLVRRLSALLEGHGELITIAEPDQLQRLLGSMQASVYLMDLRHPDCGMLIRQIRLQSPDSRVLAIGSAGTDPAREAEALGIYSLINPEADRQTLDTLCRNALEHVQLSRLHTSEPVSTPTRPAGDPSPRAERARAVPLPLFTNPLERHRDLPGLFEQIIETFSRVSRTVRSGLYTAPGTEGEYVFQSGMNCPPELKALRFSSEDPLVTWMNRRGHIIAPHVLSHTDTPAEAALLRQALTRFGAEIILPLNIQGLLHGWIFLGRKTTGLPHTLEELEAFSVLAEQVATTLENAFLYEQIRIQQSLAESLFHTLPTGIIAVDAGETIRWFNQSAREILRPETDELMNKPVRILGSRLAGLIRQGLQSELSPDTPQEWRDPATRRCISLEAKQLHHGGQLLGLVAYLQDTTHEHRLKSRREELERTAFWTELAASMSHEIRNPLVAIKTFAQLLPERYQDEEFREHFGREVSGEVDRLNGIIDQIHAFAHPRTPQFTFLKPAPLIHSALKNAEADVDASAVHIIVDLPETLPDLHGDEPSLTEGISHLLQNALEACAAIPDAEILVTACPVAMPLPHQAGGVSQVPSAGLAPDALQISVRDNACSLPADLPEEKLFSPFYTTKARGMGLGLPITRRTAIDHGGTLKMVRTALGAHAVLTLPLNPDKEAL